MCSPMRSLYPPVLTPLGGRPPGNKGRLSDTSPPPQHTHTLILNTHPLSGQQKKIGGERKERVCKRGRMNRAKGKWAALNGVDVCRGESQRDERGVEIMRVVGKERKVYKTVLQGL